MIPNMFKIAGELTATVFHVTARTVATHALSIFGDHGDVMGLPNQGWALLSSDSGARGAGHGLDRPPPARRSKPGMPFIHFTTASASSARSEQDRAAYGRRRSGAMIDMDLVAAHPPTGPSARAAETRGTAKTRTFCSFKGPRGLQPVSTPPARIGAEDMDQVRRSLARSIHLFDYTGAPDATA